MLSKSLIALPILLLAVGCGRNAANGSTSSSSTSPATSTSSTSTASDDYKPSADEHEAIATFKKAVEDASTQVQSVKSEKDIPAVVPALALALKKFQLAGSEMMLHTQGFNLAHSNKFEQELHKRSYKDEAVAVSLAAMSFSKTMENHPFHKQLNDAVDAYAKQPEIKAKFENMVQKSQDAMDAKYPSLKALRGLMENK